MLQQDLAGLDIPLHIETVEPRVHIPAKVVDVMKRSKASELFANIEYEIDELDRDEKLIKGADAIGLRVTYVHDQCVVEPGTIVSGVTTQLLYYFLIRRLGNLCPSIRLGSANGS
jgi:deoxyribodipyrimidine photo-lyase